MQKSGGRQTSLRDFLTKSATVSAESPDNAEPIKRGRGRPKGSGKLAEHTRGMSPTADVEVSGAESTRASVEPPKKRGRPRKTPSTPELNTPHEESLTVPKKRGRPPKVQTVLGLGRAQSEGVVSEPQDVSVPRKRGRPPKVTSPVELLETAPESYEQTRENKYPAIPKKRGRPPKINSPSVEVLADTLELHEQTRESSVPVTPKKRGRPPKSPNSSRAESAQRQESSPELVGSVLMPKKRGRPPKNQTVSESVESLESADSVLPRKRGRPPKLQVDSSATYAEQAMVETSPELTTPKKRGRPRKISSVSVATDTEQAIVETSPELTTPKKRGRPRKISSISVATDTEQSATEMSPELTTPKKRGRPRKISSVSIVTDTEQNVVPRSSEAYDPDTPKKRGRPRKSPIANDTTATPELPAKKRGRPKGSKNQSRPTDSAAAKQALPRRKAKQGDDDAFSVPGDSAEDNDDEVSNAAISDNDNDDGNVDVSDVEDTNAKAKSRKVRKDKGEKRKYMRHGPAWFKTFSCLNEDFWAGPINKQKRVNPTYVDVGLDERTWSALRAIYMDPAAIKVESSLDVVAKHLNCQQELDGVSVTLLRGEAPDASDPVLKLQPSTVHELAEKHSVFMVNTNESITSIDWAPQLESPGLATVDYVATGSLGPGVVGSKAMGVQLSKRVKEPVPGAIQIWRLATAAKRSECRLGLALLHTFGRCLGLKWCPVSFEDGPTIGILAAIFGDGHLRVCVVPECSIISPDEPVYVHWPEQSLVDIRAPHGIFTALNWASADVLVAGTSRGCLMAWDVGAAIQAQHALCMSNNDSSVWPYNMPAPDQTSISDAQLIPMINHQVHDDAFRTIDVCCSGSVPENTFETNRNARGFKPVSLSDLHVLTLGLDGRFRQVLLQFPTRVSVPLEYPSRRTPVGVAFWFYGTCVYSENDKGLRLLHEPVLSTPRDPWMRSTFESGGQIRSTGLPSGDAQPWNQGMERPSMYVTKIECPTLALSVSDMHPYVGVAKSDGKLMIANMCIADLPRYSAPQSRSLYTVQCASSDEQFVYTGRSTLEARPRGSKRPAWLYNLYMPQVSILACAWSRNPQSFTWIASASANGVLRIENAAP
ncbi:hypothetical protein IW145_003949 [Coemansia sp. RSA 521]|nr:hypothetical protein J3F82_001963 [Coemansia sp. RSA 637]KAJ2203630.1 hypothetical protein IW145_003949 [Coemansia sp. RSA 521]KAJ2250100.1 hypothetical protein GGH97_000944 [Coemansia sp. RSA 475]KAJ2591260.1 hypothetical protein IWW49_001620 [Coemansia sp. RSA 1797]